MPQNTPQQAKRGGKRSTSWGPGQSGNPGGRNAKQREASEALKSRTALHAESKREDGRGNLDAVLDSICTEAIAGSEPHARLYLAYVLGKPVENVNLNGDGLTLTIRKRVVTSEADANNLR